MTTKSKYARVNWKQSDAKIAARLGVTRQAVAKARKKKGIAPLERIPGGGRPPGPPLPPDTAVIAVRVSVGHKEQFDASVPPSERRRWMEERIESHATVLMDPALREAYIELRKLRPTKRGDGGES